MSAGAPSSPAAAGTSTQPASFQELVTAVSEQIKAAPPVDKSWKIAGFNAGNLWAIVLLVVTWAAPKIDETRQKLNAALDSLPQIRAAAQETAASSKEMATWSKLTSELITEMRAQTGKGNP